MNNSLILGDCKEVMSTLPDACVDLVYLDPPFFSNRDYEVVWGDDGEVRSFPDRWAGGIEHYIDWLKERVTEMYRVLKPTGSLFLHCDWHANAYIRVEILDRLFGRSNFRNEIIWKRTTAHNTVSRNFGFLSDSIFFYSKSETYTFNAPTANEHDAEYAAKTYRYTDEAGRYYRTHLVERNAALGIRPNLIYEYKGYTPKWGWMMEREKLEKLDAEGKLTWNTNGKPQRKIFLDEVAKPALGNVWDDIPNVQSGKERIGYPTQKPLALMERIVTVASNEGDTVLDPFCGGGTTIVTADKLKRKWIGIDQSVAAVKVTDLRLRKQRDLYSAPYDLRLRKYSYDTLRSQDALEFERWIIGEFGGTSNAKQRGDLGLDGRMPDGTPIQVKRSDYVGRNVVDNFLASVMRHDERLFEKNKQAGAPVGYIIAFSFGKGAIEEVARLKNSKGVLIELKKVEDIAPYGTPPKVELTADEIAHQKYALNASAESDAGISFYSWDFEHDPEMGFKADVLVDKDGHQTRKFEPGEHHIAVEAIDNNGLEGLGKVKVRV